MPEIAWSIAAPLVCLMDRTTPFRDGRAFRGFRCGAAFFIGAVLAALPGVAQSNGALRGEIFDPSGALVPGARVTLTEDNQVYTTHSDSEGIYIFKSLAAGPCTLQVAMHGFALFSRSDLRIPAGQMRTLNVSLEIATQQQSVTVRGHTSGVSVAPEENAGAMALRGSDLDALSDDPDELQNELQALAGPAAGPNGGQIYIDGFTGGQLPPKSSIREIRVNQNPFSAEFDSIGYGRIEILTKPGSENFSGHITSLGSDSAWNTANPLVPQQPSYYFDMIQGDVNGPLSRRASYFINVSRLDRQNQNIIDALNPVNTSTSLHQALPNPSLLWIADSRVDVQFGKNNTVSIRDNFYRSTATGNGPGQLNLAEQAYNLDNLENDVQLSDTVVVNARLLNETHLQWRWIRNNQEPSYFLPTVTVQGAFTTGGNNSGIVQDHQNNFEVQNYSTMTAGSHTIRFGTRLRSYQDANYSNSGANGDYLFTTVEQYQAQTPAQYQETLIANPLARVLLFDGALFYQDDWRMKETLTLSYGLRFETQSRIRDHADWAPRLAIAWAPGHAGKKPAKTVLRAGYGWFYNRFTVPNYFNSSSGAPYIVQAVHQNGVNERSLVVNNPDFYNPNAAASSSQLTSASAASIPSLYSIDPHFHAALNMQGGLGLDQAIGKRITFNVTYLYTRGIHQYLTSNATAPAFNPITYTVETPLPSVYNYQFQSEGIYKQHQVIVTGTAQIRSLSLHGYYTFNHARSDTEGVTYVPSDSQNLDLDYGRPSFGLTSRMFLLATYAAPHGFVFAPLLSVQSGTPYNLVIGSDLTENNQFNARPTFGLCGAVGVVSTSYGCLDSDPLGKGGRMIPYGLGTGPPNVVMHMRISKVFGIGPRIRGTSGNTEMQGGGNVNGRGLGGGQVAPKLDANVPRKYSLTIIGGAINLFNIVNLGTPNGTLQSPLFGKTESLAGGPYASPTPGNRTIFVQAVFAF